MSETPLKISRVQLRKATEAAYQHTRPDGKWATLTNATRRRIIKQFEVGLLAIGIEIKGTKRDR